MIIRTVLVVSLVVFDSAPQIARFPWLLVLAFPPIIWAAMRLGPTGASVSLVCMAALCIVGATQQLGRGSRSCVRAIFTTKPEGLGLGLPIARSIATAAGGRLWGETNPDGGATFHPVLPIHIAT
jgi:hypothetical protein